MGKVMTGDGTVTNVPNHVPKENGAAKPVEKPVEKAEKPVEKEMKAEAKADVVELEGLEPGDKEFSEAVRKRINAKHRAMKEAQEAADDAERSAENQYNERVLAQKRAEAAEARLAELEAKPKAKATEFKKPTADDKNEDGSFKYRDASGNVDWDLYTDAKADYAAEVKQQASEAKRLEEQHASERVEREKSIKASVQRARDAFPDFDQVMKSAESAEHDQVPQWVLNYLGESNDAGFVAYHLAKHPDETQRIAKLKPILGLAELGKLADKLTTPKEATKVDEPVKPATLQRGGAPPPIMPLSSGEASVNTDPSKMKFKELRAYERARDKH